MTIRYLPKSESPLLSGKPYELSWSGRCLDISPFLAFDCETELAQNDRVPRLALVTVSNGRQHVVVKPGRQLADFIHAHKGAKWVGWNAQFDWWAVRQNLETATGRQAPEKSEWWAVLKEDRLQDLMLLDFLVILGKGGDRQAFSPRGLGQAAQSLLGLRVDKKDAHRLRYGELIGVDWDTVTDPGWWEYAITDTIATWHLAPRLQAQAEQVIDRSEVAEELEAKYGPLTVGLQTKASVVLADVGFRGMALDAEKIHSARRGLEAKIEEKVAWFRANHPGILDCYKVRGKWGNAGELKRNQRTGVPRLKQTPLRAALCAMAEELDIDLEEMPRTPKNQDLTTSLDPWREVAGEHPLVANWSEMMDTAKLLQFIVKLDGKTSVHPSYRPLVRTGRTSCREPNVQQMPREPWFRELFIALPGHKLAIVDYSAIELRTLAAVCLARYGWSVLADTIKAGRDPHAFTAAMIQGLNYDQFMETKKTDPTGFKRARQAAKAVNFGVPGGLGARRLAGYAKANYGVEMSLEEASTLRHGLITKVYPELSKYLSDDFPGRLAERLGCSPVDLSKALDIPLGEEGKPLWGAVRKIIGGKRTKVDGTKYNPVWLSKVWRALGDLCKDASALPSLLSWSGGPYLENKLCLETAVTLTGRVRAGVSYCEARNTPFQGLAADGAKLALWNLWKAGFKVVAFIHDEIVCEVLTDGAEEQLACMSRIMCDSMAEVLQCDIPVEVEGHLSERWSKS